MKVTGISTALLLCGAGAIFSQPVFAQYNHAHAIMPWPSPRNHMMRSHAWAVVPGSVPFGHGPGQSCGAAEGACYYGPSDLVTAYATSSIAHSNGGAGMTVAVIDAYFNSQTEGDLAAFNNQFGLPACTTASGCLTIVNHNGINCTTTPSSCATSSDFNGEGWALETDLDLAAVHSLAPNAHILLVTGKSSSDFDLYNALRYGAANASVVTNSYGEDEFSGETFGQSYAGSTVPLLFSSGDAGAITEWPCTSPDVVCVGGTKLLETATSFRNVESAWGGSDTSGGSGGGCSTYVPAVAFQNGFSTCGNTRGVPDVSALADPYTGLWVYLGSFAALGLDATCTTNSCTSGFYSIGGTSLAAPLTAAVIANIDADRVFNGKSILDGNFNALLYQAASTSYRYRFYDVSSGTTGFAAGTGWDKTTGLGVSLGPALATYLISLP